MQWFPLIQFRSPMEIWENEPTYLLAEVTLFYLLFSCAYQSFIRGNAFAQHVFFAASCGGILIELLTILHPQIGNFWHSQAMIMLFNGHEPMYMLFGVYIWFNWVPVMIADKITGVGSFTKCIFAGLFGGFLFGVLDLVGAKFLWWMWHNGEPLYDERHFGVPIASTYWMTVSISSLYITCDMFRKYLDLENMSFVPFFICSALAGPMAMVGVMNVPFMIFYHPIVTFGGFTAACCLWLYRGLSLLWLFVAFRKAGTNPISWLLKWDILLYLFMFSSMFLFFDPSTIVRESLGQEFGPCGQTETSFWGAFTRTKYVCASQVDVIRDQYDFHCIEDDLITGSWYTVCGVEFSKYWCLFTGANVVATLYLFWLLPDASVISWGKKSS